VIASELSVIFEDIM